MLGGVASGIAGYVGVDTVLIRIAFVVLTLMGAVGHPAVPGVLAADPG